MAKGALTEIPGKFALLLLSCAFVAAAYASPVERGGERSQTSEPCLALNMFRTLSDKSHHLGTPQPSIMSERYVLLREAMAGFELTGMPLLAFDGKTFLPAGRTDDPGIYYFIPELARRLNLCLDRSIKVFFVGVLTVSMLWGLLGFFLLFQHQFSRFVALVGVLTLWRFCSYIKDVYIIQCVIIVGVIPLFLYLFKRGKPDLWFALFTVIAGAGVGFSNIMRRDAGLPTAVFIVCILLFSARLAARRKLILLLLLSMGIVAPPIWFHHLTTTRDAYFASHQPNSVPALGIHPFWHPVYLGFAYLTNPYVPKYLDEIAVQKVCSVSSSTAFVSTEYESILKSEVYSLARQHPGFVLRTIIAKTATVGLSLLVYANFGLLVVLFYPKDWPVEFAFWSGLALSSLYGILVMPTFLYLLGFITLATVYGITCVGHAVESGALSRLAQWIKIDALQKSETEPSVSPSASRMGTSKFSPDKGRTDGQPGEPAVSVPAPAAEMKRDESRPLPANAFEIRKQIPPGMRPRSKIYVHVRTGRAEDAKKVVESHYGDCDIVFLLHRELREAGWKGQIRALSKLKGEAVVFYCQSIEQIFQPQVLVWTGLVHRCRDTAFADASGHFRVYRRKDWIGFFPKTVLSALSDVLVLLSSWVLLQFLAHLKKPFPVAVNACEKDLDVCYLYPYPLDFSTIGGALSHVGGFLGGLAKENVSCEIFSGRDLPSVPFSIRVIPARWTYFLLWEPLILLYSFYFVLRVRKLLGGRGVRMIYQRHGRFIFAGVLLSRWLKVPLVLEYNGSEEWTAEYWDPSRFRTWLRLCERVSLSTASLIVVVSEPLRADLLRLGIPDERILVNPNGVDPETFRPECGGGELRGRLGFGETDIIVSFIGSFSYWHGIPVLQNAIQNLLGEQSGRVQAVRLRFLLIGDGPLHAELRAALRMFEEADDVIFTGAVAHDMVPAYLDASDILVSPHLPAPDGKPFFGSPTKLFEYMAMAKPIIASNLDQLALVLEHEKTALLITPGDSEELENAIVQLAYNPELRFSLGRAARAVAIANHTWQENSYCVLSRLAPQKWTVTNRDAGRLPRSTSRILVTVTKPVDD